MVRLQVKLSPQEVVSEGFQGPLNLDGTRTFHTIQDIVCERNAAKNAAHVQSWILYHLFSVYFPPFLSSLPDLHFSADYILYNWVCDE